MWFLFRLVIAALRLAVRSHADLMLENIALRHQLEVYRRSRRRVRLTAADRRFWSTLARSGFGWRGALVYDRPRQALGLEPPNGPPPLGSGPIITEPVLGGLHHVYRRAA